MDILDTHRTTPQGYRYILVVSDYFSKWTDAFPLRRHTARVVADIVVNRWIVYHGVPKEIHSDQGKEFGSELFRRIADLLGAQKIRSTPYRPQSDGQVERFNRTLLGMLSAFVSEHTNDWDRHLPYVLLAYRTSLHASTGCSPQLMVYGKEANLPVDLIYPTAVKGYQPSCGPDYVDFIRSAIRTAHEFARDHLQVAATRQKRGYDAHAKTRPAFQPGDLVRYYYPPVKQGNKFGLPWTGPWRILKRLGPVDYQIELVSSPKKTRIIHHDVLKPYERPDLSDTLQDPSTAQSSSTEEDITKIKPPVVDMDKALEDIQALLSPWDSVAGPPEPSTTDGESSTDGEPEPENEETAPECNNTALIKQPAGRPKRVRRKPARYRSN